jgi:hypothetical protein
METGMLLLPSPPLRGGREEECFGFDLVKLGLLRSYRHVGNSSW